MAKVTLKETPEGTLVKLNEPVEGINLRPGKFTDVSHPDYAKVIALAGKEAKVAVKTAEKPAATTKQEKREAVAAKLKEMAAKSVEEHDAATTILAPAVLVMDASTDLPDISVVDSSADE